MSRLLCDNTDNVETVQVLPLAEVQPGDLAGPAGHPGVDLLVRQNKCMDLDSLDVVCVVAEEPGHGHLPDLLQLLQGEAAGPPTILIEKPVPPPDIVPLPPYDAGEGGP